MQILDIFTNRYLTWYWNVITYFRAIYLTQVTKRVSLNYLLPDKKKKIGGVDTIASMSAQYPDKLFRRVMHNFRNFSSVLWHYCRHVIYLSMFYTNMQHYATFYANWIIAAKTVVHDNKAAKMRQYISPGYTMLHNIIQICHIILHNFVSDGEKAWLGILARMGIHWADFCCLSDIFCKYFGQIILCVHSNRNECGTCFKKCMSES